VQDEIIHQLNQLLVKEIGYKTVISSVIASSDLSERGNPCLRLLQSFHSIAMTKIGIFCGFDESNPYNTLLISGRQKVCPYLYLGILLSSSFFHYPLYAVR